MNNQEAARWNEELQKELERRISMTVQARAKAKQVFTLVEELKKEVRVMGCRNHHLETQTLHQCEEIKKVLGTILGLLSAIELEG